MGSFWSGADPAKNVVNDSPFKNAWARSILEDADNVRRLGTDGRVATRDAEKRRRSSFFGTAMTCAPKVC